MCDVWWIFDYIIESSTLIDSSQIAKIFDKKEKTVATKVQKSELEKYETDNVKILKNYGLMNPDAIKPRPFYDLRQMLEGPAQYYFKQIDEIDLIEVIIRVAIGKHREWFIIVALTIIKLFYIHHILKTILICRNVAVNVNDDSLYCI